MPAKASVSTGQTLAVLHPVFALTGVLHAAVGALLPSLALTFGLSDSDSGFLLLLYFAGTSLGALLCRTNYARAMIFGFVGTALCCLGVSAAPRSALTIVFFLLGISVGVPMSAISLFAGCNFPDRRAAQLTFLNFSWSAGALAAPLFAALVLRQHGYRAAYVVFAAAAGISSLLCGFFLEDKHEAVHRVGRTRDYVAYSTVLLFAFAAFLQVGIENTAAAWLPTYALRTAGHGIVLAAILSACYWVGFLTSRGASSLLLIHTQPLRVLRIAVVAASIAGVILLTGSSSMARSTAMFLLGAALAPIYPLVIATSMARVRRTSDSRWVLATAGFGGSVLPWLAGAISSRTDSLRMGMLIIPASLLVMLALLPLIAGARPAMNENEARR